MNSRQRRRVVAGVFSVVLGITMAACGDDDDEAASDGGIVAGEGEGEGDDDDAASDGGMTTAEGEDGVTSGTTGSGIVDGEALPELPESGEDPAVGMAAPALTGQDYTGEPSTFTPGEDGPTLVTFLAHWCPHCNAEIPVLLEWQESGDLPDDLNVVGVSTAVDPNAPNHPPDEWLDEHGWPWQVIADTDEAEAYLSYGAGGFPMMVLVDENGEVVARDTGEKSIDQLNDFIAPVTS